MEIAIKNVSQYSFRTNGQRITYEFTNPPSTIFYQVK
jgi:hypothetical protein